MNPKIFEIAKILSDKSCSRMLILLMDGRFHTVSELARAANIKNQTATYHIKKFTDLKWIEKEIHGRFHYYRLYDETVAEVIEQWLPVSKIQPVQSLNMNIENKILFNGRTCYDHLAGKLGVELTKWLIRKEYVVENKKNAHLTDKGINFFNKNGINIDELKKQKRCFCRMCMDWSERDHHIAGSIGKGIADFLLNNKWIEPHGKTRGVRLTSLGKDALSETWNASEVVLSLKENI